MEVWIIRFWKCVDKTDYCWNWKRSTQKGYGISDNVLSRSLKEKATHRISWVLTNGPVPAGMDILHTCDNRLCVNPSHLFIGNDRSNTDDKVSKGRQGIRLNPDKVRGIRIARASGRKRKDIAREYGVGVNTISRISKGLTWRGL